MDKEHIISEIIRTAAENGGKPLGRMKFETETGIKVTDWDGKYWTRWSDAIKEAGFEPNKFQSAYDENYLIEQLIVLIREKKGFPTYSDIRFKSYNTKGYPSHNTFNSLGKKREMIQKVLAYCQNKPEYQDVVKICNAVPIPIKKQDENDSKEDESKFGYVYLMKSGRFYKIGKSYHVGRREYEVGIQLPEPTETIHESKR